MLPIVSEGTGEEEVLKLAGMTPFLKFWDISHLTAFISILTSSDNTYIHIYMYVYIYIKILKNRL